MGVIANWMDPKQALVAVEAVNIGNQKTTITHLFVCYFPSRWARMRGKPTKKLVVVPDGNQPLPFELEPGARWVGSIEQTQQIEELSHTGYLYIGIHHSVGQRGLLARLVLRNQSLA